MAGEVNYNIKANGKSVNGEIPSGVSMSELLSANVDEMQAKVGGTLVVAIQIVKYVKVEIEEGQNVVEAALSMLDSFVTPFDCSANIDLCVEGKVDASAMDADDLKALAIDPEVKLESREMTAQAVVEPPLIIPSKKVG